jgi:hypothetical protein
MSPTAIAVGKYPHSEIDRVQLEAEDLQRASYDCVIRDTDGIGNPDQRRRHEQGEDEGRPLRRTIRYQSAHIGDDPEGQHAHRDR